MRGIFYEGRWYENTGMVCCRCGRPVYKSDVSEYIYQCFYCDEDLYSIETKEQDVRHLPPVMIARPVDGITINEQIEYLLDDTNNPRVFNNKQDAETFLIAHGFTAEELEHLYFVDVIEIDEPLLSNWILNDSYQCDKAL